MNFFVLLIYLVLYLLMPHAWGLNDFDEAMPLTVLSLSTCLLLFIFNREEKLYSPQFLLLCGLCIVILLSALSNHWLGGGVTLTQQFLLVAVIPFLLFSNLIKSNENQKTVMWVCIISAVLMVTNGISQINADNDLGWAGSALSEGTRITYIGVLNDPNDLGAFFVLVLPFTFYFSKYGRNLSSRSISKISSLFILYGIYLTNSRGALLATITMFGMYFYMRYGKLKSFFLTFILSPLVLIIMSSFREIDASEESASGRVEAWYEGIEMLKSNPFFGVGMGGFTDYHHLTAHNSFVLVMSELGVIGYALWFCFYGLSFYMLLWVFKHHTRILREGDSSMLEKEGLSTSLSINGTLFYSFVGYTTTSFFLSRSYHFFTYFICALAFSSYARVVLLEKDIEIKKMNSLLFNIFSISLLSIIAFYLLVKFLL